jgi:outer membrane protein TolC
VTTSRAALAFLIGSPWKLGRCGWICPPAEWSDPVEAWLAEAPIHRQDLAAAAAAVEAARQSVRAAIGEYFPSVTLNLQLSALQQFQPWTTRSAAACGEHSDFHRRPD